MEIHARVGTATRSRASPFVSSIAHLRGVRLDGVDHYRLCDGALTQLPFKIWHALDGIFAYES